MQNASLPYDVFPIFQNLLPALDAAARAELRGEIERDGKCRDALVVAMIGPATRPVLIDGHQRLSVISELRDAGKEIQEPTVVTMEFATDLDAQLWMLRNPRRNPDNWDRARSALKLREALTERAKENMSRGGRGEKVSRNRQTFVVRNALAEIANVKPTMMGQIIAISDNDPDLAAQIDAMPQKGRPTVGSSWKQCWRKLDDDRRIIMRSRPQPGVTDGGAEYLDQLLVGNSREVLKRVPDCAATLFVFSIPYPLPDSVAEYDVYHYPGFDQWLQDFRDVMQEAFRTLRIGGRVAVNIDATNPRDEAEETQQQCGERCDGGTIDVHYHISRTMYEIGFKWFAREITWFKQKSAGDCPNYGSHMSPRCPSIRTNSEKILLYCKDTRTLEGDESLNDCVTEEFNNATMSTWNFDAGQRVAASAIAAPGDFWYINTDRRDDHWCPYPVKLPELLIRLLTRRGDLVVDPYSGVGTSALAAMLTGRRYLGIDLSAQYTVDARARLDRAAEEKANPDEAP